MTKTTGTNEHANLLADLNDPQRQAVTHTDGPLLVLAGPGSGKTRVITRRAAYLGRTVAQPREVLAITFTNKAAGEMRDRLEALGVGRETTARTFHSFCALQLRIHHQRAGLAANYTIADQHDRRKIIKEAVKRCGLDTTNFPPARLEARISQAKNAMMTAAEFTEQHHHRQERHIVNIFQAYEALLAEQNLLDFDDLLLRFAVLLRDDAELRARFERRFRYVLIDEYQDTNRVQYVIARELTRTRNNLCVTGDPDQSIYGWRGADIGNILRFEEDYPRAKVVRLEQNYRSTQRILAAADALIAGNVRRKHKELWTGNPSGRPVRILEFENATGEARQIVSEIVSSTAEGKSLNDIAVFYRVNSLSRLLEEALIKGGVPYQIARGTEFYQRKEIKDVLAYLRVMVNPADEVSLLRILNTPPRGIGQTTIGRLQARAADSTCGLMETITQQDLTWLGKRPALKVGEFAALVASLQPLAEQAPRRALEQVLSLSGLRAALYEQAQSDPEPQENVNELVSAAAQYERDFPEGNLLDWVGHTTLVSDVDSVHDESGRVTLMTLHAAKGLEYVGMVYIVALEDGMLPFRRRDDDPTDRDEEERRLCFVGMTRAKEELTLTRARYRMLHGKEWRTVRSPFLDELPGDELEWIEEPAPVVRQGSSLPGRLPDDIELWEVGSLVTHARFGRGRIESFERGARRTHVDVRFESGARESFVLEFSGLERVDLTEVDS